MRALAVAGALAFAFALTPLSAMAVGGSTGVQVAPARVDLPIKPSDNTITTDLKVRNRGSARNSFSVSVVDVVVHGFPESLAPGSTPYSLAALTTITPSTLTLDPGQEGTARVSFDVSRHRPVLGALLVRPAGEPGSTATGQRAIGLIAVPEALVTVSMAPVGQTGELLPSVSLGLDPVSLQVPAFVESGPIVVRSTVRDTGTFFERLTADYTFSGFGHPFLTVKGVPADAMPGQTGSTAATTRQRLEASGQSVETTPVLCLCQVTVLTYAELAGRRTITPAAVQTAYVVVFPWKIALAVVLMLSMALAWRTLRRRTRR